jgi:hypothetical protein
VAASFKQARGRPRETGKAASFKQVLAQPHWQGQLTPRDTAALTPLIWEHVNPYGRFDLDMNARLALL